MKDYFKDPNLNRKPVIREKLIKKLKELGDTYPEIANMAFIYVLADPITNDIRYVGKAHNIRIRYRQHVCDYNFHKSRKTCWICSLLEKDLIPNLFVVETCNSNIWEEREIWWIKSFRESGSNLSNSTDGGDGLNNPTEEVREKIKMGFRGKTHTEEVKKYLSIINSGENHPLFGKQHSKQTKRKMSLAKTGENHPLFGKYHSEDTKKKISLGMFKKKLRDLGISYNEFMSPQELKALYYNSKNNPSSVTS